MFNKGAWRELWEFGFWGHALGLMGTIAALILLSQALEKEHQANVVSINPAILGVSVVHRLENAKSYVYKDGMHNAHLDIKVYRVGTLFTAQVTVKQRDFWWRYLRPAKREERRVWQELYPGPYDGQRLTSGPGAVDGRGFVPANWDFEWVLLP